LSSKKDFQQLEDFNRGRGDDDYQKQYFEDLFDPASAKRKHLLQEREQIKKEKKELNSEEELKKQEIKVDEIYNTWEDTEDTTLMWKLISTNAIEDLKAWLQAEPHKAFIRSKDGRGPMFWSFELRSEEATKLLMKAGVPHTDRDASGKTPVDLLEGNK
jgi:dolichyl-diphosphooligosaccharide--protein glycosyltransferase